jgi:PKHD-type hydroxylase
MRGKIQIYRPLLTPFQCEGLIELARDRLAAAECVNLLGERRVSENRRADTFLVDADETRWLYELADGLTQEYFDVRAADELRAFSGVEVVRYPEGGYFQPHHDVRSFGGWRAEMTGVIQLSPADSYQGGDLCVLMDDWRIMPRDRGRGLLFPASSIHEVTEVQRGERWVAVWWGAESRKNPLEQVDCSP